MPRVVDSTLVVKAALVAAGYTAVPVSNDEDYASGLTHPEFVAWMIARSIDRARVTVASRAVATRGSCYNNSLSNGTDTGATYRLSHTAPVACGDLSLTYANILTSASGEADGNADITVRAAIEYGGAFWPVWFNGSRDAVLKPGAIIESSPTAIDLPAGAAFFTRTYVTVASVGQKWPRGMTTVTALSEGGNASPSPTDQTTSGTITALATPSFGPMLVRGRVASAAASVLLVGDSIMAGVGATNSNSGQGFAVLALGANFPHSHVCQSGETAQVFAAINHKVRLVIGTAHTHALCNYGTNDLAAARTAAQVEADLVTIWTALVLRGLKTYQCTIIPRTTSTDSWVTTGNQTPVAGFAVGGARESVNTWLRDGAPIDATTKAPATTGLLVNTLRAGAVGHPLSGVFETADTVESARNSGVFKANYTADGIHPNETGHESMSAAITTSLIFI